MAISFRRKAIFIDVGIYLDDTNIYSCLKSKSDTFDTVKLAADLKIDDLSSDVN